MPSRPARTAVVAAVATVDPGRTRSAARGRILRAAQSLFAGRGFDGCSLRDVAALADVNQGMIHYFFKSKETLFLEAYLSCGRVLVDERLALLDAEEAAAGGAPVALERLIEIFLAPAVRLARDTGNGRDFLRMQARLQLDGSEFGARLRSDLYDESSRRFVRALIRVLPGLTPEQVHWRFVFMLGTYQYALADTGRLEVISDGRCDGKDFTEALHQMIPFVVAGMRTGADAGAPRGAT